MNRFTLVESQAMTDPGAAPISRAILFPTVAGRSIQPAAFQPRISILPQCSVTASPMRAFAALGRGPSEFPSR